MIKYFPSHGYVGVPPQSQTNPKYDRLRLGLVPSYRIVKNGKPWLWPWPWRPLLGPHHSQHLFELLTLFSMLDMVTKMIRVLKIGH